MEGCVRGRKNVLRSIARSRASSLRNGVGKKAFRDYRKAQEKRRTSDGFKTEHQMSLGSKALDAEGAGLGHSRFELDMNDFPDGSLSGRICFVERRANDLSTRFLALPLCCNCLCTNLRRFGA
jgi:hypothetical protein